MACIAPGVPAPAANALDGTPASGGPPGPMAPTAPAAAEPATAVVAPTRASCTAAASTGPATTWVATSAPLINSETPPARTSRKGAAGRSVCRGRLAAISSRESVLEVLLWTCVLSVLVEIGVDAMVAMGSLLAGVIGRASRQVV